jgi:hypothetical protein
VVIKGGSVSGAARFAAHLERTDTNERRNEVIEMRGVAATDLRGALREMEAVASACPNCKKPLYQASINTQAHERLTGEQRMQAVDRGVREGERRTCGGAGGGARGMAGGDEARDASLPDGGAAAALG